MALDPGNVRHCLCAVGCSIVLLTGCGSSQHRVIELDSSDSSFRAEELDCELSFDGVVDRRQSKRFVDPSWNTYDVENFLDYLDGHIDAITCCGQKGPELKVEVRHAYAQGKAMRGFYTVVLSLILDDSPPIVLRGRHDVTNWLGSSREFQLGLTAAADQALNKIHAILAESKQCRFESEP